MQIDGAVIKEQGVTFAVAIVRPSVLDSPGRRDEMIVALSRVFGGLPTVLMAQNSQGTPRYYGRRDLVGFMASVPLGAVQWKRYTVS